MRAHRIIEEIAGVCGRGLGTVLEIVEGAATGVVRRPHLLEVVVGERAERPVVAVGADVRVIEEAVEAAEPRDERVLVRRDGRAEHHERRIAVGARDVAQHLIVRPVFLDDVDDVFERAVRADHGIVTQRDVLHQLEHGGCAIPQRRISGDRDAADRADEVVGDVAVCARRVRLVVGIRVAALTLAVGDEEHAGRRIDRDRGRIPAGRDRAHRQQAAAHDLIHGDGVRGAARNVEPVAGDRERVRRFAVGARMDREREASHRIVGERDRGNVIVVAIGDEEVIAVHRERVRMPADRNRRANGTARDIDGLHDRLRAQRDVERAPVGRKRECRGPSPDEHAGADRAGARIDQRDIAREVARHGERAAIRRARDRRREERDRQADRAVDVTRVGDVRDLIAEGLGVGDPHAALIGEERPVRVDEGDRSLRCERLRIEDA